MCERVCVRVCVCVSHHRASPSSAVATPQQLQQYLDVLGGPASASRGQATGAGAGLGGYPGTPVGAGGGGGGSLGGAGGGGIGMGSFSSPAFDSAGGYGSAGAMGDADNAADDTGVCKNHEYTHTHTRARAGTHTYTQHMYGCVYDYCRSVCARARARVCVCVCVDVAPSVTMPYGVEAPKYRPSWVSLFVCAWHMQPTVALRGGLDLLATHCLAATAR